MNGGHLLPAGTLLNWNLRTINEQAVPCLGNGTLYPVSVRGKKRKYMTQNENNEVFKGPLKIIGEMHHLISQRGHRGIVGKVTATLFRSLLDKLKAYVDGLNERASQPPAKMAKVGHWPHVADEPNISQINTIYCQCISFLNETRNKRKIIPNTIAIHIEKLLHVYLKKGEVLSLEKCRALIIKNKSPRPSSPILERGRGDEKNISSVNRLSNQNAIENQAGIPLLEVSQNITTETLVEFTGREKPLRKSSLELPNHFDQWMDREQTGEIILLLGGNSRLRVHKDILKDGSDRFDNLILKHYAESQKKATVENPYEISLVALVQDERFSSCSIEHLVRYFYTKRLKINDLKGSVLLDLWSCARYFLVNDVAQVCIDQLKNGRYDSPIELYILAKEYRCHEIAEFARQLICRNPRFLFLFFVRVFNHIDQETLSWLKEILQSDEINLSERTLSSAVCIII